MQYTFNIEIAQKYSVNEAIMLQNLQFWISKNKKSEKHQHQGRTWTYNSLKNFQDIFPFWSKSQIERILKKLIQQDILITGNFNSKKQDRTCWYAFKNEKEWLQNLTFGQNVQKSSLDGEVQSTNQKISETTENENLQKTKLHSNTFLNFEICKSEKQEMQISKSRNANLEIEKSFIGTDNKPTDKFKRERKRFDENFSKTRSTTNQNMIKSLVFTFLLNKTSREQAENLTLQFLQLHPNTVVGNLRKKLQRFWVQINETSTQNQPINTDWIIIFLKNFNCKINPYVLESFNIYLQKCHLSLEEIMEETEALQQIKKHHSNFYQSMRWETFFRKIEEGHSFIQEWERRKSANQTKDKNNPLNMIYRPRQKPNKVLPNSNPNRYFRGKINSNNPETWYASFQNNKK